MSEWLEWMNIEKNPDHEGSGVYKIRLVSSKGLPIKIPRFLGDDKEGILYIGHTEDIKKRISFFRGAMQGKQYSNAEGQRLHLIIKSTSLIRTCNNFEVQYSFRRFARKVRAKLEKERLLERYFKRYGEAPPANNNKSVFDILFRQNTNIVSVSESRLPVRILEEEKSRLSTLEKLNDLGERGLGSA
jgi:predicted GIY-YIG superfamily endonuclease